MMPTQPLTWTSSTFSIARFLSAASPLTCRSFPRSRWHATRKDGVTEGFLGRGHTREHGYAAIGAETPIADYLRSHEPIEVLQHGLTHEVQDGVFEFGDSNAERLHERVRRGRTLLENAGLGAPSTFVPPQDHVSRSALRVLAEHFDVVSGGWYSLERVPRPWWPSLPLELQGSKATALCWCTNTFSRSPWLPIDAFVECGGCA